MFLAMPQSAVRNLGSEFREALNDEIVKLSVILEDKIASKENFCSFEVFSGGDTKEETYQQLFSELDPCFPLFNSITWHEAIHKGPTETHPSLKYFEKFSNITLLHLPARGLSRENVIHVLNRAVEVGKANIFALRGDGDKLDLESKAIDFPYAVDLVKFIRAEFGSKISICVAGYPEMHPKSPSKEADLFYLKEKVDAGADFIITQIVFESEIFIQFVRDCRRIGITVPVIPGVVLISSFNSVKNVLRKSETRIPQRMQRDLDLIKDNEVAIQEYGIKSATTLINEIFKSGTASGFHLFTLNRSQFALELCKRVGLRKVGRQSEASKLPPIKRNS